MVGRQTGSQGAGLWLAAWVVCNRASCSAAAPTAVVAAHQHRCRCTTQQVARQKLPADWHKRLQAIQGKMAQAVKELPAGLLAQVAGSGEAPVDYFRAVAIRDKLAQSGERSLFGGLTGQAGIWDKIVKAYENGGEEGAGGPVCAVQ